MGFMMFDTHSSQEHLAMMERILGPLPTKMVEKSKLKYFSKGCLKWDEESSSGRHVRKKVKPWQQGLNPVGLPSVTRCLRGWASKAHRQCQSGRLAAAQRNPRVQSVQKTRRIGVARAIAPMGPPRPPNLPTAC